MELSEYLTVFVLVALMAAFVIGVLTKWGVVEWMQVHGDSILSRMFSCDFCLSFWMCTLLLVAVACVTDTPLLVFCGGFCSPITRRLL